MPSIPLTFLQGQLKVTLEDGYVHVWHGRSAQTLAELDVVLRALEGALRQCSDRAILFDSRDSDPTPPEVQDKFWNWLSDSRLSRVATLVRSKNLSVSLRMTGISRRVSLRGFDNATEAVEWLRDAPPPSVRPVSTLQIKRAQ